MATKRTPLNRAAKHSITPRAVELFEAGDEVALLRELGLNPLHGPNPIEATTVEPPYGEGSVGAIQWPLARQLRRELLKASRANRATKG